MDPSYNNSFGTQPNLPSQPIISSGSGDIVLPPAPKKSKKPLIITLIIILLSALLGLGAWWYLNGEQDGGIIKNHEIINYIENGDDSITISSDEESDLLDTIFAVKVVDDPSKIADYYQKLRSKINSNAIEDEVVFISNVLEYSINNKATTKVLKQFYDKNSYEKTKEEVEKLAYKGTDPVLKKFSQYYTAYYNAQIDAYHLYKQNSCVSGEYYIAGCAEEHGLNDALGEFEYSAEQAFGELRDPIELKALSTSIKNIFIRINKGLINEQQ